MKRAIGAVLAAVILMVSCLSGCGGGGGACFPDNGNLKLTATQDEIIEKANLEKGDYFYSPKNGGLTTIDGIPFEVTYSFLNNKLLRSDYHAWDSETGSYLHDEKQVSQSMGQIKSYFDSVYGSSKESSEEDGYCWITPAVDGRKFQITAYISQTYVKSYGMVSSLKVAIEIAWE